MPSLRFRRRFCPCCRTHLRRFERYGRVPRPEARCPACGSLERHRLNYLYLVERTDLFDGGPKRMLHVAPEPQLSELFQEADGLDYVSADLAAPNAMVRMDIRAIQYPDASFDVVYCGHVLDHVDDDRRAMAELHRVLKPRGWAILNVPVSAQPTHEDATLTTPEERRRLYGDPMAVRRYGTDYVDRLAEAGFAVTVERYGREFSPRAARRFGLRRGDRIHLCRREAD